MRKRWQSIGSNLTPFTTKLLTQSFTITLYPSNKINQMLLMALTASQCLHIFISLYFPGRDPFAYPLTRLYQITGMHTN